jgi:hypothetical protein
MFETKMPFGRHRGKPLSQVPLSYLAWALRDCEGISWQLRSEIRSIVEKARRDARDEEPTAGPPAAWDAMITKWFREMCLKFHPDRGGNHEAMKAINFAHNRLKELIGQ